LPLVGQMRLQQSRGPLGITVSELCGATGHQAGKVLAQRFADDRDARRESRNSTSGSENWLSAGFVFLNRTGHDAHHWSSSFSHGAHSS
jgi:hypothetical protein